MSEYDSELSEYRSWNPLERLNNRLCGDVVPYLPSDQAQRLTLNLKSMRGKKVILPCNQGKSLRKRFSPKTIEELSKTVDATLIATEGEYRLGNKVLEVVPFQKAIDRKYRSLQVKGPNQQAAFDYWIKNFHKIPEDLPIKDLLFRSVSSPLGHIYGEIGLLGSLLKIRSGIALKSQGGLKQKAGTFLVDSSINSSVGAQMRRDIQNLTEVKDAHSRDRMRDNVLNRYGCEKDSLEAQVFSHPDYFPRLLRSGVMNATYYGGLRQLIGWSAFAATVKVTLPGLEVPLQIPGTVERFQSLVDQWGTIPTTLIAAGALAGLMLARARVDSYVLKKCDMTPDTVELGLALARGRVDEYQNLRANPKYGFVGPVVDVLISSTLFSWAWFVDFPYSVPGYLFAMGVDQISFMGSNLGYALLSRRKDIK